MDLATTPLYLQDPMGSIWDRSGRDPHPRQQRRRHGEYATLLDVICHQIIGTWRELRQICPPGISRFPLFSSDGGAERDEGKKEIGRRESDGGEMRLRYLHGRTPRGGGGGRTTTASTEARGDTRGGGALMLGRRERKETDE